MFKFIHTSDWHLGQNFYGYDRSEEQSDFLRQLADIVREEQPDALLVSGDVYHTSAPSSAAVGLYVEGMLAIHDACPKMEIIVIAGNHDSASRLESDSLLWERSGVKVLGGIARTVDGQADLGRHIIPVGEKGLVAAVPFAYPTSFPRVNDERVEADKREGAYFAALLEQVGAMNTQGLPVALMAHLAVNDSDFTGHDRNMKMECVEVDTLGEGYDYAALGHIHRPQQTSARAWYCGTPIAVSFDENCDHVVNIVEIDAHGSSPRVTAREINNIKPLLTIPPKVPVELDDALAEVEQNEDVKDAYIRLNVKVEQYLPNGSQERAASAVGARGGRYCEIKKTATAQPNGHRQEMTVEEFHSKEPIEVVNQYYIEEYQREMTEQEKEMFNYVYQLVQEDDRQ